MENRKKLLDDTVKNISNSVENLKADPSISGSYLFGLIYDMLYAIKKFATFSSYDNTLELCAGVDKMIDYLSGPKKELSPLQLEIVYKILDMIKQILLQMEFSELHHELNANTFLVVHSIHDCIRNITEKKSSTAEVNPFEDNIGAFLAEDVQLKYTLESQALIEDIKAKLSGDIAESEKDMVVDEILLSVKALKSYAHLFNNSAILAAIEKQISSLVEIKKGGREMNQTFRNIMIRELDNLYLSFNQEKGKGSYYG